MRLSASIAMVLSVICLAIGNFCDVLSLRDKQKQIDTLKVRTVDLETVVTKLHNVVTKQQESLERQGRVNTSLMNITEQLVKERNVR